MDRKTIQQLSSTGRYQACIDLCQNFLHANPDDAFGYKYAGKSLLALGQLEEARQSLVKAHQLDGSDPEIVKDLGNIFKLRKNYAEAIRFYKVSLSIDPNFAPALNNLGLVAQLYRDFTTAEKLVKKASDLDQSFAPYHMNLGGIYKDLGQLDQALSETLKSIELKPDNPNAHMILTEIYYNLGQLDQALAASIKSIELEPDNPMSHMILAGIYYSFGQADQALAATLKSIELKPDNPDAFLNLGGIYKELGQLDQALASTLKSNELKPDNPDVLTNLGMIYKDLGNLDQALASTLKSLEFNPDNPMALSNLGSMYFLDGQHQKAKIAFEKSLSLKKASFAMMSLSMIHGLWGDKEESIKYALEAVEIDKSNEDCLINLATQCDICDRTEQAINAALKAIEINKKSEKACLLASKLFCKQKLFAKARQVLEKARKEIDSSHMLNGELVRVKFLEGLLDEENSSTLFNDDDDYYFEDCNGTSLIISFGSNGRRKDNEKNIPLFNFRSTLQSFADCDKLFIRDLDRCYYMFGISKSSPSILNLTNLISRYVRSKQYENVITLGASSGGFGALLYGNLIGADYMIAFNPQTTLDVEKDTIIKDNIFAVDTCKMLRDANKYDQFYRKCLNLRNFIPFSGEAVIHFSSYSYHGIDKRYAEYLQHKNCIIKAHESSTHLLALELKEKGTLIAEIVESMRSKEK